MKLYQAIANAIVARKNCDKSGNVEWFDKWTERLEYIAAHHLPRGSGFDSGTSINLEESTEKKIILESSFHHMNHGGMYDGWTKHKIIVTPSFISGFDIHVTGRDRNGIKDYIAEYFGETLRTETLTPFGES